MAQITIESLRRISALGLPQTVKDLLKGPTGQITISDCKRGACRQLSITERKQLNVLKGLGDFDVYHAIKYTQNGEIKTAFLVTSPYTDEWEFEFFNTFDGYGCFSFVFNDTCLTPVKEVIRIALTGNRLSVSDSGFTAKTATFV